MVRIAKYPLCAVLLVIIVLNPAASAASSKIHTIAFGKWITVPFAPENKAGEKDEKAVLKVRPMLVDARVKEFTFGSAHEITERLFVVRRALRLNDSLPQESGFSPHWVWQRGGWLLIDRATAHISAVNLPEFDAAYSEVVWYRDYAAYCGVSDDGKKFYAMVVQLTRRKPALKKILDGIVRDSQDSSTTSVCPPPTWQRNPSRVTFEPPGAGKQTFAIRGREVDLITAEEVEEEEAPK
jgi:hypothetical protein